MAEIDEPPTASNAPWIVCVRRPEFGTAGLYAFSTRSRAYLHAARLIRDEIEVLLDLDNENGQKLLEALRDGRYDTAVELYHAIEGNVDAIDVERVTVNLFHDDRPIEIPDLAVGTGAV